MTSAAPARKSNTIPSLSNQSECAKSTFHSFGIYYQPLLYRQVVWAFQFIYTWAKNHSSRFIAFVFNFNFLLTGDWVNDDSVTLFYRLRCAHRRRTAYIPNEVGHRIYKFKEENRLESETFTHVTTALNHHGKWRCQLEISKGVARAFYRWDSQYGEISLTMW